MLSRFVRLGARFGIALGALIAAPAGVHAGDFPQRPVRLIVPFAAGGPTDVVARLLAQGLSDQWGRQAVVENRAGAGGNLGTELVAKSPPDGHTLALVPAAPIVINRFLFEHMPFDPQKDLAPISLLAVAPLILYVRSDLPAASLTELVRLAQDRPGQLNFTSAGTGSMPHVAGEMFRRQAGIDVVHVPYKGAPQAIAAVVSGEGAFVFDSGASLALVKAGRLRALAATGRGRPSLAPEVPNFAEVGLPGFSPTAWFGLLAPAGTPPERVRRIRDDAARVLLSPEARARLAGIGFEPVAGTPEAFAEFITTELLRWEPAIRAAGIRAD